METPFLEQGIEPRPMFDPNKQTLYFEVSFGCKHMTLARAKENALRVRNSYERRAEMHPTEFNEKYFVVLNRESRKSEKL